MKYTQDSRPSSPSARKSGVSKYDNRTSNCSLFKYRSYNVLYLNLEIAGKFIMEIKDVWCVTLNRKIDFIDKLLGKGYKVL